MKLPPLGLYSRFFVLFGVTTLLLAFCLAAGVTMVSENSAREFVQERHQRIQKMLRSVQQGPVDINKLREQVKGPRVDILVIRGDQRWATADNFPDIPVLLANAEKIESLYLAKHRGKYYLLAEEQGTWVVVTSLFVNLLVYSNWLMAWPWGLALVVLCISYLILRRLLRPVAEATHSAKMLSQGQFGYRITRHPNTELAELTRGLNKMAGDLQQLFDAKSDLLLAISHELRTPLARMKISLAMLEGNEVATELSRDITQMDTLIEQLLEGERLQQGHKVLHLSSHYLPSLVEEIIGEAGVRERVELVGTVPEKAITVDIGRIKFLLRNLLANAIAHGPDTTAISLAVRLAREHIEFVVTDSGPGIPADALAHIFEPFYCVQHVAHRDTRGTGLGLYLCQRIAHAHHGELEVESVLGEGSCFTLTLPR